MTLYGPMGIQHFAKDAIYVPLAYGKHFPMTSRDVLQANGKHFANDVT